MGNLFIQGTTLIYSGTNANNVITLSGSGGTLAISDTAGTISSSVPGFGPNNTSSVSGTLPSYVHSIAINGNGGVDTVTIAGSGLSVSNAGVSITASTIFLDGDIDANAGSLGGNVTLDGSVIVDPSSTTAAINTQAVTAGSIQILGPVVGDSSLTSLTLDAGSSGLTGNVTLAQPVTLPGASSNLIVEGNTIQTGALTVSPGAGTGLVSIYGQNSVALKGDLISGAGGVSIGADFSNTGAAGFSTTGRIITDNGPVSVTTLGTGNILIQSIDTTGTDANVGFPSVSLLAGGAIEAGQSTGFNVHANSLTIDAGTTVNLNTSVETLDSAFPIGGSVAISNSGLPLDLLELSTSNGSITVSNDNTITAGSAFGAVSAGGTGQSVTLKSTGASSDITAFDVEAPLSTVTLNSGGAIDDGGSGVASVLALTADLSANGPIGTSLTPLLISASNLQAASAGADTGALEIDDIAPTGGAAPALTITGATTLGGSAPDVDITTQGAITVNGNVASTSGDVTLVAFGLAGSLEGTFEVRSGVVSTTGAVTLEGSNIVQLDQGTTVDGSTVTVTGTSPSNQVVQVGLAGTIASTGDIDVDGGGSAATGNIISVTGTLAAGGDINVNGGANPNTFLIEGQVAATGTIAVNGGASNDVFIVTPSLASTISLYGNGGTDALVLALTGGTYTATPATNPTQITFAGGPAYQPIDIPNGDIVIVTRSTD